MSRIKECIHAFCVSVSRGTEEGIAFSKMRQEVDLFSQTPWSQDADLAVQEYFSVPNHVYACTDLDYKRFSTNPLVIHGRQLHIHHILEGFSHTNPPRYASVWLPLLDLAEAVAQPGSTHLSTIETARQHLQRQIESSKTDQSSQPNSDEATTPIDAMMHNLLGNFPGLQTMVQQMLSSSSPDGDLGNIVGQIQGLLNPLLTQAAASATEQDPSLQPAIGQILQGFSALTNSMTNPNGGGGGGDGGHHPTDPPPTNYFDRFAHRERTANSGSPLTMITDSPFVDSTPAMDE